VLLELVLLSVVGLVYVVPILVDWLRERGIRTRATPVEGRVVDIDIHGINSRRPTRPIARYRVGDHDYEVPVANVSGRLPLGSSIELLVDPGTPYVALAAQGHSTATTLLVRLAVTAAGATGVAYLLARR
jgi:hypothetical protein